MNINMSGGRASMTVNGLNIEVRGKQLFVNGQAWGPLGTDGQPTPLPEPPRIVLDKDGVIRGPIHGDLYITGSGPVTLRVEGDIDGSVTTENGDVACRSIGGSVRAKGSVQCSSVGGSVHAEGDVTCGSVGGSVRAANVQRR